MSNYDTELIASMRQVAEELTKVANSSEVDLEKMASVNAPAANISRSDYISGVIEGLGIR